MGLCLSVCVYLCLCLSQVGLPDLPYFTGDPVFQTPFSSLPGGSRREEQISRILLVRLSRHSGDTVTRENFVQNYYRAYL